MDIIQAIKNEAFKQDISLAEIARKLGMKPQNFNQILRIESIKFQIVEKIAIILNVSIDYLQGKEVSKVEQDIKKIYTKDSSPVVISASSISHSANITHHQLITEETIRCASLGYQDIILEYQKQMNRLISVIEKLEEKI